VIDARRVSKRFGRVAALADVSFSVADGEALAIWGSNGAGKTTLIRCLLGVFRFEGAIEVNGIDLHRQGKRARSLIGYVPQELAFHDDTRLGSAMSFFAGLRRVGRPEALRALETVGLEEHGAKRLRDLSGGMKQRLALAIALLSDPPIVVLDEPTSNLDADGRRGVVERLQGLRRLGKTLVFASHRPEEVAVLADRVLVLEDGRLIGSHRPHELWATGGNVRKVRLHVSEGAETAARDVLRDAGHAVELNGNGLCVTTPRDRKGAPIAILGRAAIDVHDFEVLDGRRDGEEDA
jgi:ABC-type multidrug transport system ATPase subunit